MSRADHHHLPPLPSRVEPSAKSCAVVRLYLAVEDNLSADQLQIIAAHIQLCSGCAHQQQIFRRASLLVATLNTAYPSERVDQAVMAAITTRGQHNDIYTPHHSLAAPRSGHLRRAISLGAVAALLALALCASLFWLINGGFQGRPSTTLELPTNLSWNSYVLYQTQTTMGSQGKAYQVTSYQHMADDQTYLQIVTPGKLDIVIIENTQKSLGLDMMHHVAQWDVHDWDSDASSLFDLDSLRHDLRTGHVIYQGKISFDGQEVYRIRYPNGDILLLDMHYMPVNVLVEHNDTSQDKPIYNTLRWLHPSQVSSSLWNMTIPDGFTMGNLPSKP
jgi:hypothetical protein